ncbi:hypothetical protein V8E36_004475 [Tilletia maclaganii]
MTMTGMNSSATSSRMLDDAQLQAAALFSLANASSTADVVKRREDAIRAAHQGDAKPPHESRLIHAEMEAIRVVEHSMSEAAVEAGVPSRRPASPLPAATQPSLKRSRTPAAASGGPGSVDVQSAQRPALVESAVERFFGVSELVSQVFQHLAYDRIDLVSLSTVSKRCRSIALPMLVQSLSIPFSKSRAFSELFESNPGLILHVHYLRLWDDVADATSRQEWNNPARQHTDADWADLGDLLARFERSGSSSAPTLELSVGQLQLFDVRNQFLKAPRLLGRLTSLLVLDDVWPWQSDDLTLEQYKQDLEAFSRHVVKITETLTVLLHDCFVQQGVMDTTLQNFAFKASRVRSFDVPQLGPHLLERLTRSLTHLKLNIALGSGNIETVDNLLGRRWSKLESIDLCLDDQCPDDGDVPDMLRKIIKTHSSIRHIYADVTRDGGPRTAEWCDVAQPQQIAAFGLEQCEELGVDRTEFAERHKSICDLGLPFMNDGSELAANRRLINSLRILRGHTRGVDTILRQQNQLREVHIQPGEDLEANYHDDGAGLLQPGIRTSTVTFLSLDMEGAYISLKSAKSFPNVIELALIFGGRTRLRPIMVRTQGFPPFYGITQVFAHLEEEVLRYVPRLRALLIKDPAEVPLPVGETGHVAFPADLPRRLEYLTWLAKDHQIQHFRTLRRPAPHDDAACLQLLPAIFRPKVDRRTGFWENIFDPRHSHALFDHLSGDEPRLKYVL